EADDDADAEADDDADAESVPENPSDVVDVVEEEAVESDAGDEEKEEV
ncbi:uncharacterized protein METZ01_LOCUS326494, partial [marine metagenome]